MFAGNRTFLHVESRNRSSMHTQIAQWHHHCQVISTTIDDPEKEKKE
jgi:hypothetical protein